MAVVLFVMKYPLHRQENLQAKFDGQMAAVRKLGNEVFCIGWDKEGMWLVGEKKRELLRRNRWTNMPGYEHTKIFTDLMAAVRKVLATRKIDLLYLRYMPTFERAAETMRALKKQGGKLIIEFPTYPRKKENQRSWIRRPVFFYTDWVLRRIHPMVDLYTVIGEDCGGTLDGKPAVNIVNGIDVDSVPLHVPNEKKKAVHLLALASMAEWHGYDRMLRALAGYRGEEEVYLHLVGADGDGSLAVWTALAAELDIMSKVCFHGARYGDELNQIVADCDVGVGCLGVFRRGNFQILSLKLREYMARGIPFVYAEEDPVIPDDSRFSLRVENSEAPIDMAAVVAFANRVKAAAEVPALMRAYAREHMSWTGIMAGVLERVGL